jgi:hypothetical protein
MLTGAQQTAWNDFAIAYPQPTQWNPARFLNGYNLFCRWNFFNRLVNGQATPILTEPDMSEVADTTLTPTITNDAGSLILDADWSRTGADIWGAVFMSRIVSAGSNYIASQPRFIVGIENGGGVNVIYGLLYNYFAVASALKISSSDNWVVPSDSQFAALGTNLGGNTVAGGKMRDTNTDYWANVVGVSNSSGFTARGAGTRNYSTGGFGGLKGNTFLFSNTLAGGSFPYYRSMLSGSLTLGRNYSRKEYGYSIRLLYTGSETPSSYVGNDGKTYPVITISTQTWLAANLCETKFRNNDFIPFEGINSGYFTNAEWAALSTPGLCAYDNTYSNAFVTEASSFDISAEYFNMFGRLPQTGDKILMKVIKFNKISGQFLPEEEFFIDVL